MKPFHNITVGIAGGSCSGKTTFAASLAATLGPEQVVALDTDSYYHDFSHLSQDAVRMVNFDHPDSLDTQLLSGHIESLRKGTGIEKHLYDFTLHARGNRADHIEPKPVIIIEGIFVLAIDEIRKFLDFTIFIEADDDLRLVRRIRRDMQDRGRSLDMVLQQYLETVKPMHAAYVIPSKKWADTVITQNDSSGPAAAILQNIVRTINDRQIINREKLSS